MKEQYKKLVHTIKSVFVQKGINKHAHRATHDWLVSLSITLVSSLILCGVGAATFFYFRAPQTEEEVHVPPQATFSVDALNELVSIYREQAQLFTQLRTTPPVIPLPGVQTQTPSADTQENTEEEVTEIEHDADATEPFVQ